MKNNMSLMMALFFFTTSLSACGTFPSPTPQQIIDNPLGTSPLKIGMSKEEVTAILGQPNEVIQKGSDELGSIIEEWIYYAQYPAIPVDHTYLSKTQILIFSGNNLTKWE